MSEIDLTFIPLQIRLISHLAYLFWNLIPAEIVLGLLPQHPARNSDNIARLRDLQFLLIHMRGGPIISIIALGRPAGQIVAGNRAAVLCHF